MKIARAIARTSRLAPHVRYSSSQSLPRILFPDTKVYAPADWSQLLKKAAVRVTQYAGFASVLMFWPYPIWTIAEAMH
ncbi:hypothetical protein CSOJ01_07473 [Colletotrichum sojae]|uniref:Uncharacterized protein n=1 Tax=Colletotrichum sojae TaxID=2175907 RepID=A0A8H6J8K9_9PEZI|nr:hypothetical protein CSOJ01_07473 [Colletotrichum sojae]